MLLEAEMGQIFFRLSCHLPDMCSVRRWRSPAERSSLPLRLTFWTNWWGEHLVTTLASDPISKVKALRCEQPRSTKSLTDEQEWRDFCRRGCFLLNRGLWLFSPLTHSLELGFSFLFHHVFTLTQVCSHPCMLPHRPISVQSSAATEWSQQIPSDMLRL